MKTTAPTVYTCDLCKKTEQGHETPKGWGVVYLMRDKTAEEMMNHYAMIYDNRRTGIGKPFDLCAECYPVEPKVEVVTPPETRRTNIFRAIMDSL